MRKIYLLLLAYLAITNVNAQSTIDKVFTTLKPNNSMAFYVVNNSIYGIDYTDGIVRKYNKVWNLLETHDAHQETYNGITYLRASQGYEYNSALQKYQLKQWGDSEPSYTQKKKHTFSMVNYSEFIQGQEDKLFYIKQTSKPFVSSHSVNRYGESYKGIAGEIINTTNYYTTLITNFEFVNWDGELVQTIVLPYYVDYASPQFINVEDKSYIVIGANKIYKKDIPEDWDLHSGTEYDIDSKEVEADVYHHFVFEYVRETNEVNYVRTFTSSKEDKSTIAVFDMNGMQLSSPQKGVNLILYSDGSSKKVVHK